MSYDSHHARLSPSSSERWISCPASVLVIEALPREIVEQTSVYAEEGTVFHSLIEILGRAHFGHITKAQAKKELTKWRKENGVDLHTENEMQGYARVWLEVLQERFNAHPGSTVYFEQRLNTGVPSSWGTTDAGIVSMKHLDVIDAKYGAGVQVDAEDNSQLRLYALGMLDEYDILGTIEDVTLVIVQPRIEDRHGGPHISTETLTVEELRAWRESILPIAASALLPDAPFGPSAKACRWCPMSGKCKAQLESIFEAEVDFESDPLLMDVQETAELLEVLPRIKDWVNAFEAAALHRAYDLDEQIPGWKVVMSNGRRGCVNEEAVLGVLQEEGYKLDDVTTRKIVGIGVLEALLGKKEFTQKLGTFYPKSSGKPSLVPESDNRPALNREAEAATIFAVTDVEEIL